MEEKHLQYQKIVSELENEMKKDKRELSANRKVAKDRDTEVLRLRYELTHLRNLISTKGGKEGINGRPVDE
jgi:regulator of replication initiation timing